MSLLKKIIINCSLPIPSFRGLGGVCRSRLIVVTLLRVAASSSFIVVSMRTVIRGFGLGLTEATEAMTPIAGKGEIHGIRLGTVVWKVRLFYQIHHPT